MLNPLPTRKLRRNYDFPTYNLFHESGNQKPCQGYSQLMAKEFQPNVHRAWEEALCSANLQGNLDTFTYVFTALPVFNKKLWKPKNCSIYLQNFNAIAINSKWFILKTQSVFLKLNFISHMCIRSSFRLKSSVELSKPK